MARHELGADARAGDVEDGVGQAGKLLGDIRKRGHPQHVAQCDAQNLPPSESRQFHTGGHTQVVLAKKIEQPLLVPFHRQNAVEAARIGDFQDGLGPPQHRVGEKPAIREDVYRALQRRRRIDDALKSGGHLLPQSAQVQGGSFGIGYRG